MSQARQVGLAFVLCLVLIPAADAQSIGGSAVSFLQTRVGTRVGGGECAQMATEALRVAGGEFVPSDLGPDSPSTGDYAWGTLVTTISYASKRWSDSNPTSPVQVGDIIQYGAAKFGTTSFPTKHTAIVTAVNATKYRPTAVYQQNFNGVRSVQSAAIDVTKLTAGWIRIYRPKARTNTTNKWKYTVVNNASTSQTYTVMVGTSIVGTVSLTAANTAGSFKTATVTTTGTVPCLTLSGGATVYLQNAKADEIYNPTSTTFGIRQLAQ